MDRVGRRVLEDQGAGRQLDVRLDDLEDAAPAGDEALGVDEAAFDVVVAADRVEVVSLVVVERRLVPQPLEHRIRISVDVEVVRVVIDVRHGASPSAGP